MSNATDLAKRHGQLKSDRGTYDSHCREISERVLPRQADYWGGAASTPGAKRTDKIYDSAGEIALTKFAAVMEALLTPQTQQWSKKKAKDEALNQVHSVKLWFEQVNKIVSSARRSPATRFHTMAHEFYMSLGAFGTAAMFIDKAPNGPLLYKTCHIGQIYFAENAWGVIDTVHREIELSARQATQKFKRERLPSKIITAAEKTPDAKFTFVHCVKPNEEIKPSRRDYRGMEFASYYISVADRDIVQEGGYRAMPYAVGRYVTGPKEIYGRSPAMTVLPDIKMVNEMSKTVIRAAHKIIDPPLLLQEDGALQAFDLRPGALNYGGVNDQGQQVVHALQTGARVDIGLDMMEQRRKVINDAFLVTLFQILVDAPQMTATEAMLRAQEKALIGFANLTANEREELASVMRSLVGGIDRTLREVAGTVQTVSGCALPFDGMLDDNEDIRDILEYIGESLQRGQLAEPPQDEPRRPVAQAMERRGGR